ncbi:hypothetical protein Franean1_0192 [Parafrankia sp. EAN1pec]|nr:hypothetical protein Franean1_0192 [Frankia sp. EAN1pec]
MLISWTRPRVGSVSGQARHRSVGSQVRSVTGRRVAQSRRSATANPSAVGSVVLRAGQAKKIEGGTRRARPPSRRRSGRVHQGGRGWVADVSG